MTIARGMPTGVLDMAARLTDVVRRISALERAAGTAGMPRSLLDYAFRDTPQTGITAIVDIADLVVTWEADPTRRYEVKFYGEASGLSGSGDIGVFRLTDAANVQKARAVAVQYGVSTPQPLMAIEIINGGASGLMTRKVRGQLTGGVGPYTLHADTDEIAFLSVEDLGVASP